MGKDEIKVIRQYCKANDFLAQLLLEVEWDRKISNACMAAIKDDGATENIPETFIEQALDKQNF